jgi:hypothetical protein
MSFDYCSVQTVTAGRLPYNYTAKVMKNLALDSQWLENANLILEDYA